MAQPFGHEKLIVYQKGLRFAALRSALLSELTRRVAACDHLDRGAESILVNIAHASNTWFPKERIVYLAAGNGRFTGADQSKFYETAYKSTIHSASLLDLVGGNEPNEVPSVENGRELLRRVAAMLTALSKGATHA